MIPYFSATSFAIGPISIHVWGLFVAVGFLVGAWMAARMAKKRGDDPAIVYDLLVWMMAAGMIGGRLGHVIFYDAATYIADPLAIFRIWEGGLSSYGGFIACLIVGVWYLKRRKVNVWRYADAAVFGLPFGYAIGRIGCFLIHDHPGTATDFALGVQYPDGTVRHDLGLYLSIQAAILGIIFLWISRKERPIGAYIAAFSIWYGITRFFLDFLRLIDVRYGGLTPAQYFSLILLGFGIWLANKSFHSLDHAYGEPAKRIF